MPWASYRWQIYGSNHYICCRGNATIYFCSTFILTVWILRSWLCILKTFCTLVKVKNKVFLIYAVKLYRGRRGIIQEPFVTKAQMKVKRYEGEWLMSRPNCFPSEKYQWYQFNRRLWAPELVWAFQGQKKWVCYIRIWTPYYPALGHV